MARLAPASNGVLPQPTIRFDGVEKTFDRNGVVTAALNDVSFNVSPGEFVCVLGPSGCGKSTLLNMAAGLASPSAGTVQFLGEPVRAVNTRVGYMTQTDTLLPWRTVYRNASLPLEIAGCPREERDQKVTRILELVGLGEFQRHYPSQLSGGMRRRLMLARTLVAEPQTVLMDEPFGALDAQLKLIMQEELLHIWATMGLTILFVTHDIGEAITMGTRLILLSASPSHVKLDLEIDLPQPRDVAMARADPKFAGYHESIWSQLREDFRRRPEQ